MKKAEALRAINVRAQALGYPNLSEAVFEDWINEDLIKGARPHGIKRGINPDWDYDQDVIDTALKILKLKACGARRFTELRSCLWLKEIDTPAPRCIRDDLSKEFHRILTRVIFRNPWDCDERFGNPISEDKFAKFRKRIKREVDSRLVVAGLVADDKILIQLLSAFMFGVEDEAQIVDLLRAAFMSLSLNIPSDLIEWLVVTAAHFLAFSGIFGHPDEIEKSGLDELRKVDQNDLVLGRTVYQGLLNGLEFMAIISKACSWEDGATAFRAAHLSVKDKSDLALTFFAIGTIAAYRFRQSAELRSGPRNDSLIIFP